MSALAKKMGRAFKAYILRDSQLIEARRWIRDRGDTTLRLDYPLDQRSIVFDLGGYHGDFAASIVERFDCQVYIFEPVPAFAEICVRRFENNPKVRALPFGLSSMDGEFQISTAADGSSIVHQRPGASTLKVRVRSFADLMTEERIEHIDLLKINIEGGEYDVLPHLMDRGIIDRISNLQIQFHNFVEGHVAKRDRIRAQLSRTHTESWCYPFVWESWRLKSVPAGT